ncbi:glycosyltransferase [Thermodesulfovibrionales bacterium]|nr:glycosyltransferase [Thermodesulfovibrionales bacterium]MCL0086467.1 glycosyltransferase [Thermodesulfovibrionales bacterium]
MKLCDITQFYNEFSGGIKTYINQKRRYLIEQIKGEHVLIAPGPKDHIQKGEGWVFYQIKGFSVSQGGHYRFMVNLKKIFNILRKESPDLVEIGSPYIVPLILSSFLRNQGIPSVGFFHTNFPEAYIGQITSVLGRSISELSEKWAWLYAGKIYECFDLTLTPSSSLTSTLVEMVGKKVETVKFGTDVELFHPQKRGDLKKALGLSSNCILLLYVGRIDREKRVDVILDALMLLPRGRYHLLVVGKGPMEKKIKDFNFLYPKLLTWRDYCRKREELAMIYASADIYVTMGKWETFGLSILEAQASGLPVVGVNGGAVPERVPPGTGLLVNSDDPRDLAAKIERAANGNFRQMGMSARQMVERDYRWDLALREQFAFYQRLLK